MREYLLTQNKTNETIIQNTFSPDELERFSKSDYRWAENRTKSFRYVTAKKGEIYQFEFGKNYIPEMSYEHRGLIIGVKQKLLYVLPIFSYDLHRHPDVYHPINNPNSKSNLFLLKKSEFSFIKHDSILKLNDIRTVSINRILYQQSGRISPSSDTYKQIETLVLKKYFPNFYHDFKQASQTITSLNKQLQIAVTYQNQIESENEKLKAELTALKEQIFSKGKDHI